jgi:uncharacterized Zn-binding protein involved in type VI secretion
MAKCTTPNVCKMPGPPAPFVPTPLPNIGKSNLSPQGYSTTVKIEGQTVAIRGATFESMGDMASKATGGGLISANVHGPTKFITPGSMTVKIEGKNVHQLGEPMLNNCGPGGSPPNTGATMMGFETFDLELQDLFDNLCEDLCEHEEHAQSGDTRRKSDDLEKSCRASGKYDGIAKFRTRYRNDPGCDMRTRSTKPDVITTDGKHCFDFKLCGDESRGTQVERQTDLTAGNPPIIVSCDECGCCTCP